MRSKIEIFFDDIKQKRFQAKCQSCDIEYSIVASEKDSRKFCSQACAKLSRRKVGRPSKEELKILLWEIPTTHIAKRYGVSDKAIEKWVKAYNIEKPPRGYWAKQKSSNNFDEKI